jgi:cell shape-determining protein MreC
MDENMALKEKLSSLETEVMSLSKDRDEKDILLGLLGRRQDSRMLVASVLAHPPQTLYDVIIIDAGLNDSVSLGSEVFLPEGPILGKVSEVFGKYAKVKLFSTAREETSAVLERGSVPVTLVGVGAGNFKLTVPRDVEVERGDRILSAGVFSRLLAVVGEVNVNSTDSFKEVLASTPTNIFALRFIFVIP